MGKERRYEKIKHSDIKKADNKKKQKKNDLKKYSNSVVNMVEDKIDDRNFIAKFEEMSSKYYDKYEEYLIEDIDDELCEEVSRRIISLGFNPYGGRINSNLYPSEYADSEELHNACIEWLITHLSKISDNHIDAELIDAIKIKMTEIERKSVLRTDEWFNLAAKLMEMVGSMDVYFMTHSDSETMDFIIRKTVLCIYLNLAYNYSILIRFKE